LRARAIAVAATPRPVRSDVPVLAALALAEGLQDELDFETADAVLGGEMTRLERNHAIDRPVLLRARLRAYRAHGFARAGWGARAGEVRSWIDDARDARDRDVLAQLSVHLAALLRRTNEPGASVALLRSNDVLDADEPYARPELALSLETAGAVEQALDEAERSLARHDTGVIAVPAYLRVALHRLRARRGPVARRERELQRAEATLDDEEHGRRVDSGSWRYKGAHLLRVAVALERLHLKVAEEGARRCSGGCRS
jgi:hypothetical protein